MFKNKTWLVIVVGALSLTVFLSTFFKRKREKFNDGVIIHKIKNLFKDIGVKKDVPVSSGNESYTTSKEKITLCLKDKSGKYYNDNMLVYVSLHELAHLLTPDYEQNYENHGPKFINTFSKLLKIAEGKKLYNPNIKKPSEYCGLTLK